jgi:hypothetical protein
MWKMEMCVDSDQTLVTMEFASPQEWEEWLRENHPDLFRKDTFVMDRDNFKQRGMNYYWSCIQRF